MRYWLLFYAGDTG